MLIILSFGTTGLSNKPGVILTPWFQSRVKISTNLFPLKDAILVWFTTAIKRLFKVVQAQTKLQIEKSPWITVAENLVTDMGSASRFELALFMRKLLTR